MKTQAQTETAPSNSNSSTSSTSRAFSVYFAGDLWTHKDLIGNALLAEYILKASRGRYRCVLPQDLEEPINRTVDIRNYDLKHVMTSDMAIFNFDGADLDSGTVVEFIYAKMLDIPCVILRTDFRSAGEGNAEQDPWNLMASHWPRTKVLKLHGMSEYQGARKLGSLAATMKSMYKNMSQQIVNSLDEARREPPLMVNAMSLKSLYQWAVTCPGAGYRDLFAEKEIEHLLRDKMRKGLLSASPT